MSSCAGRPDPAARELARQLHALPAARYEFAVFDGRTVRRVLGAKRALAAVGWLKHRNGRGGHVYLRPVTTACVLVEGLTPESLARARADGLAPAAVVETAPGCLEAWFRLGVEAGRDLGLSVARILAARYGGGPREADLRRLGRAAGFSNRTAGLADGDGRYPRVRVVEARGRVTTSAEELLAEAEARLRKKAERRAASGGTGVAAGRAPSVPHDPHRVLARELARLSRRYGAAVDRRRAEAAAARRMALGGWSRTDVAAALAACPETAGEHDGDVEAYADRVVARAFGDARR